MTAARSLGRILGIVMVSALGPRPVGGTLLLLTGLVGFGGALVVLAATPAAVGLAGVLVILTVINHQRGGGAVGPPLAEPHAAHGPARSAGTGPGPLGGGR